MCPWFDSALGHQNFLAETTGSSHAPVGTKKSWDMVGTQRCGALRPFCSSAYDSRRHCESPAAARRRTEHSMTRGCRQVPLCHLGAFLPWGSDVWPPSNVGFPPAAQSGFALASAFAAIDSPQRHSTARLTPGSGRRGSRLRFAKTSTTSMRSHDGKRSAIELTATAWRSCRASPRRRRTRSDNWTSGARSLAICSSQT